jgi:hypothetical protein
LVHLYIFFNDIPMGKSWNEYAETTQLSLPLKKNSNLYINGKYDIYGFNLFLSL